ncbi:hypothetical protein, partial [Thiolapillus sp.]|uniref:hypothetical protein n=1 Tax=Thiolapillus sp. TaxID=2017437 RepID=UPI003AF79B2B
WITMALCFLQVLREPVVQYLAGSEQRIPPFWNIITWYPTAIPLMDTAYCALRTQLFSDYVCGRFIDGGDIPRMPPLRYLITHHLQPPGSPI